MSIQWNIRPTARNCTLLPPWRSLPDERGCPHMRHSPKVCHQWWPLRPESVRPKPGVAWVDSMWGSRRGRSVATEKPTSNRLTAQLNHIVPVAGAIVCTSTAPQFRLQCCNVLSKAACNAVEPFLKKRRGDQTLARHPWSTWCHMTGSWLLRGADVTRRPVPACLPVTATTAARRSWVWRAGPP